MDVVLQSLPSKAAFCSRKTDPFGLETSCNSRIPLGLTWRWDTIVTHDIPLELMSHYQYYILGNSMNAPFVSFLR